MVAIFLPIIVVYSSIGVIILDGGLEVIGPPKIQDVLFLMLLLVTIANPVSSFLTRRNIDKEVADNLYAELNSMVKKISGNDTNKIGAPLHHQFFDSLIKSGMISHVNPKYLYDLQHVYWLIDRYNDNQPPTDKLVNGDTISQAECLKCKIKEICKMLKEDA
ncbi:MAG: hypothetical protein J4G04_08395 [Nitrosopumilaceae archaeon]|nr:hypothetical protein [Nitrosopumilaceae archaeon]